MVARSKHADGTDIDIGGADAVSVDSYASKTKDERKVILPLKTPKSSKHGFTTDWGPVGFRKKFHPLSLMVSKNECNYYYMHVDFCLGCIQSDRSFKASSCD